MDTDKIKQFFVLHVEKMVFGLVVALSAFLIYRGIGLPSFLDVHQPADLATKASQVRLAIDEDHTEAILGERIPTFDILKQTKKLYTPVDSAAYKFENTWESQNSESIVRRKDPALPAPLELHTHGVISSIAVNGSTTPGDYALALLEDADPVEKVEQPKPRERRRRDRNAGGYGGGAYGGGGAGGYGAAGGGAGGYGAAGAGGYGGEEGYGGEAGIE